MRLIFSLTYGDIENIVAKFEEAIRRLHRGSKFDKPKRSTYVNLKVINYGKMEKGSKAHRREYAVSDSFEGFGSFDDITLIKIGLNEDGKTGGYMVSELFNPKADETLMLKAHLESTFWRVWKEVFI